MLVLVILVVYASVYADMEEHCHRHPELNLFSEAICQISLRQPLRIQAMALNEEGPHHPFDPFLCLCRSKVEGTSCVIVQVKIPCKEVYEVCLGDKLRPYLVIIIIRDQTVLILSCFFE